MVSIARGSFENHGLIAIHQNPVLNVPANSTREDDLLEVAPLLNKIFNRIAMRDPRDVLLDNGTVVEYFSYVVTRGPISFTPRVKA